MYEFNDGASRDYGTDVKREVGKIFFFTEKWGVFIVRKHMLRKMLLMCAAADLASGCSSITNLTPSQLPRSDSGLYPFEVVFESKATALADDSIQAYLILDDQMIKMQRTPLLTNRWEVLAPIPVGTESVSYRYKINYQWKDFGKRRENSRLSEPFYLNVTE